MTADVVTIPADATRATVEDAFRRTHHGAYPIVEAGHLVGIVTRDDLLEPDDPSTPVTQTARSEVVTVGADESLQTVMSLMVEEGVHHVPVVEQGELIGICTRTDILRAQVRQLDHEHIELGWLTRRGALLRGGDGQRRLHARRRDNRTAQAREPAHSSTPTRPEPPVLDDTLEN